MGQHKSPFKGASVEFTEHRQYYPGDEIRHIDWRAFGKTGKYYVKEYEDETNLRCYLLIDGSGSMTYSGSTLSKFDYARQLAAALGYLLLSQRDAVGLAAFDTQVRARFDASTNPQHFQRIASMLENWQPGRETSLAGVIEELAPDIETPQPDCLDQRSVRQIRLAHDGTEAIASTVGTKSFCYTW